MQIKTEIKDATCTFILEGRLDAITSPQLDAAIQSIPQKITNVIFDFQKIEYVSSAGIRILLMCRKKFPAESAMKITGVCQSVMEVFNMTGFDTMLNVSSSLPVECDYSNMSFKAFLKQKVQQPGKKAAVICGSTAYTWEDIDIYSQIAAADLEQQGVKRGTHIAIYSMNSINWIITFFAIQKLGGIAVLVNFNLKPEELAAAAEKGEITHFCYGDTPTAGSDYDTFLGEIRSRTNPKFYTHFYDIRSSRDYRTRISEYASLAGKFDGFIEPDDASVMLFTSGSTSWPKGVLLSAYNLLNSAVSYAADLGVTKDDSLCLILPLFHIFGLMGAFLTSAIADSVIYIATSVKSEAIMKMIAETKCTVLHGVPTIFLAMIHNENFGRYDVSSLRISTLGGAPVSSAQMQELKVKFPQNHFIVTYGLSEAAAVTTTVFGDTDDHIVNTIGRPLKDVTVAIQDPETKKLYDGGETGEIIIKGDNLMIGYYKIPVQDQALDAEGWLHTGDLGCRNADGYIHIVGRIKDLIIKSGENIVPNEIIAAITEYPGISDVRVLGAPHFIYGEIVIACIVMKEGAVFDEKKIQEFLVPRLAKYKMPSYYLEYSQFPLLSNGKVDMRSLKEDMLKKIEPLIEESRK